MVSACIFSTSTNSNGYLYFSTIFAMSDHFFHIPSHDHIPGVRQWGTPDSILSRWVPYDGYDHFSGCSTDIQMKSVCDCAKSHSSLSTKPASFEEPVSKTRCRYCFALRCFRVCGCGCTGAGWSGCSAGTAKKSSNPWHFRCWSPRQNDLECINLVTGERHCTVFVTWCNYRCWSRFRKVLWRCFFLIRNNAPSKYFSKTGQGFAPSHCCLCCGSGLALPVASKAFFRLALAHVIGRMNEEKTQRRASLTKRRHKGERFRP